jgi:D-methionine transport system permease protein
MDNLTTLLLATWQTVYMTIISGGLSIALGLFCGIALFVTSRDQLLHQTFLHRIFSTIINILRSVPFIILMISIIPLTRLLIGTSIGTNAAIVPLTLAATPFFARLSENSFNEIPKGLIEAAISMGANYRHIIFKVLIPEAAPSLIRGASLTLISLIGYSAMAGAIGGGGLGELAVNDGYERFNLRIMLETVIILIALVQLLQCFSDYLAKQRRVKLPLIACGSLFFLCLLAPWIFVSNAHEENIKIGITSGPQEQIMAVVEKVSEQRYHLKIKLVTFQDYVLPNTALENGSIDANIFQHLPYLNEQNKQHHLHLAAIGKTFVYPMGLYSKKINQINQLQQDAIVAIPNDPSNEGRALLILQKQGLITLKPGVGLLATPADIISNPKNLQFKLLDAAQLPRVFADADLVALTNDYTGIAGFTSDQALLHEGADSPYANVLVVRKGDENKAIYKNLLAAMRSPEARAETEKLFPNGGAIAAWGK